MQLNCLLIVLNIAELPQALTDFFYTESLYRISFYLDCLLGD